MCNVISILSLPFLFFSLLNLLPFVTPTFVHDCVENGNYTANSTFGTNLNAALSTLSTSLDPTIGFHYTSAGNSGRDMANALVLCTPDIQPHECRDCLNDAITNIRVTCPQQRLGIIWYGNCMLRYSNMNIYRVLALLPQEQRQNPFSITSPGRSQVYLSGLLDDLRSRAIHGGDQRKAAAGQQMGPDSQHLHAMVQCTPDLSSEDCNACLNDAASGYIDCCGAARGFRILKPSCNVRFEIYSFYNETNLQGLVLSPGSANQNPQSMAGTGGGDRTNTIIAVVVSFIASVVVIVAAVVFTRRKQKQTGQLESATVDPITTSECLQYDFDIIRGATNDFSADNKLGQGGFGAVYKGILPCDQEIAVKRLSDDSGQGEQEFKNEVQILASLQHKNLVRLLGFAIQGIEKLLVLELVPNGSLDHFIFDAVNSYLDWDARFKIIEGIARGLLYLHEDSQLTVIHRDLKASNILLDGEMSPKIADFGVAKLLGQGTHKSTNHIIGTHGYMPPEYAMYGQFSVKSDVFSFGVLVLEIVSGKRNGGNNSEGSTMDLLSFAWNNWRNGMGVNIIDPHLKSSSLGSISDILRCIHIGLLCVQQHGQDRPSMDLVVLMMGSFSVTMKVPFEPAFYVGSGNMSSTIPSIQDDDYSIPAPSQNEITISELCPR